MSTKRTLSEKRPFKRKCGWCAVRLRGWQLNLCRQCKSDVSLNVPGPRFMHDSRLDAEPDARRRLKWSFR